MLFVDPDNQAYQVSVNYQLSGNTKATQLDAPA